MLIISYLRLSWTRLNYPFNVCRYVDGKDFFKALYHSILNAKKRIYFTAWWLVPEIYLIRENPKRVKSYHRFDQLLKKKAAQGVEIYILVWKDLGKLLNLGSTGTIEKLNKLHPNIKVIIFCWGGREEIDSSRLLNFPFPRKALEHPMWKKLPPHAWCHHQKSCVIDYATPQQQV